MLSTLHDLTTAGQYADQLVLLHKGRIEATDTTAGSVLPAGAVPMAACYRPSAWPSKPALEHDSIPFVRLARFLFLILNGHFATLGAWLIRASRSCTTSRSW